MNVSFRLRGYLVAVVVLTAAFSLNGCSGGSTQNLDVVDNDTGTATDSNVSDAVAITQIPVEGNAGSFSVDSTGGVFEVTDTTSSLTGVVLEIPSGALASTATISIRLADEELTVPDATSVSHQYEIKVEGIEDIDLPITVRLPVTQEITEDSSVIVLSKSGDDWHMPYMVGYDATTGKAFAVTDQFSIFGAFITEPSPVPVDFQPARDGFREYTNSMDFFDSSGELWDQGTCYGVSWFLKEFWKNYRDKCGHLSDFISDGEGWSLSSKEASLAVYVQRLYVDNGTWKDLFDFLKEWEKNDNHPLFPAYLSELLSLTGEPVILELFLTTELAFHAVLAYGYDASTPGRVLIYDPNKPGQESYLDCSLELNTCTYSYDHNGKTNQITALPVVLGDGCRMDRVAKDDAFARGVLEGTLACTDVCRDYYYKNGDDERSCSATPDTCFSDGSGIVTCFNADDDSCLEGVYSRCGDGKCSVTESIETCAEDCSCNPDCTGLVCGPDPVCGQSCGTCGEGYICESGQCVEDACVPDCGTAECGLDPVCGTQECGTCDQWFACVSGRCESTTCDYPADLPLIWAKTAAVNFERIPEVEFELSQCMDYDGDGEGNCGVMALSSTLNSELERVFSEPETALIFEFVGVDEQGDYPDFTLNRLTGVPASVGNWEGSIRVDQTAYDEQGCSPKNYYPHASIVGGRLSAGPSDIDVVFRIDDALIPLHLTDTYLSADLDISSSGISASQGVFSGVLLKEDFASTLSNLESRCAIIPIPEDVAGLCEYLDTMKSAAAMLFDMHRLSDGSFIPKSADYAGNAGSICIQFSMIETRVVGYNCQFDSCVTDTCSNPSCDGYECGMDPVCGTVECGTCGLNYECRMGACVEIWHPDEYTIVCDDNECFVPGGDFHMGCNDVLDDDCNSDEFPYHEVYVSNYYIDRSEVSQAAYKLCVDSGNCSTPSNGWNPDLYSLRPVVGVQWGDAVSYCTWAGKRLPTEAEWEKAARGTDGRMYPWGNEAPTCYYAVIDDEESGGEGCGSGSHWDVCSKSPAGDSPYGLCDMTGNVGEWVNDWYDQSYYGASPASNPQGPDDGTLKVVRSSTQNCPSEACARVSVRSAGHLPDGNMSYVYYDIGFRCARDAL